MELAARQPLPVTQQQAWEALNDIDLLQRSIPGCESLTATGEDSFDVLMAASIGPVKAKFKGKLQLLDQNPPESYTMKFDGQGGAAGFGKGSAKVSLLPADDGTTLLDYAVNAQVGGKIAQVGSRLVDMAAQKIAGEFFQNFRKALEEKYPQPVAEAPAAALPETPADRQSQAGGSGGIVARFVAWLKRLFGAGR